MTALPTGWRGQGLALAVTAIAVVLVWLGAVSPALSWYADRAERLSGQQVLAARMAVIAESAPALQRRLANADNAAPLARTMFDGATDSLAGAALQQSVQDIAAHAGATVLSAEMLPAVAVGSYRRIGIHVTISGSWPVLIGLLSTILQANPRMLVDDLQLRQTQALGAQDSSPMEAGLTIVAFAPAVTAQ